ncbi:MAG TPA: alpha/beta hydrolase [Flavobacterium sp.]|jgi:proline iminopeptidase
MNAIITFLFLLAASVAVQSQTLYTKSFGSPKNSAAIFLHGGPGYNAAAFEATTAQQLADSGFFVIVYDRRGEGRSTDPNAAFTFEQTFVDLAGLYDQYKIQKAVLIGHSFGGVVGTLFAEKNPQKVSALILAGAPISMQETFQNIIQRSKILYETNKDAVNLSYLGMLEKMDADSMEYAAYCFGHAMQNGFYSTANPSAEAQAIFAEYRRSQLAALGSKMTYEAPQGFHKNEKYTSIDITQNIQNLLQNNVPVFALYGAEDQLYSKPQVEATGKLIGKQNMKYLDNCSHNVFIDQQKAFIDALTKWTLK